MAADVPGLAMGVIVAGKYVLLRKIGSGAMGEVWAARHETLDEEVAIKLVLRDADHGDGTSADSRFLLEAQVAAALSRKTRHIVAVTDHGQDGPLGYLVMELLSGEPLDQRIARRGPMPVAEVAPLITQIARGLSFAHAEGVVHRDLKPSNVFVTLDEDSHAVAKVLDFGIAKLRRGAERGSLHTTQRGFLLGTPAYMSAEQARGKPLDHRADVWALAVIAYHMLTGEFPFDGGTGEELFARLCRIDPIPIRERRPELPKVVGDFFARAFAPRIGDRFQSALALAEAFEMLEPLAAGAPRARSASLPRGDDSAPSEDRAYGDEDDASLFVAGVPRRKKALPRVLAALLVGAVLATSWVAVSIYLEREPARTAAGLTVGSTAGASSKAFVPAIPPPGPEEARGPIVISSDDLPDAPLANAPRASRALPSRGGGTAQAQKTSSGVAEPAAASPTPAAGARATRSLDKSEVF